ncbi:MULTISPECIES: carbon storage regulator [unclassified Arthrobacter]|uniref:carbon storage regulator n=1 Tax=unclassified Arthrobacter TaxID=235627 RepID=UPI002E006B8C|nr:MULTISPECIES: carbon storage regulator [unclassified Arthrobacter]MEC5192921.1 carbon storage regulator [Arthrobacter sp. MP_M4]MEC5204450.1 carbon storage regulator [Arthrobacter sp. MP_M7]
MLVLTRKPGEQIMIGDGIVITVLEGRGDGVRIGIEAPRGVPIQRREVIEAIAAANLAAAQAGAEAGPEAEDALRGLVPPAPATKPAAGTD